MLSEELTPHGSNSQLLWGQSEAGTALQRASAHLAKGKVSKGLVWD